MAKEKTITIDNLLNADDPKGMIQKLPFEEALRLLEELVQAVERGSLPLERAMLSYEKGSVIVACLRETLSKAEARMQVLKRNSAGEIEKE